MWKAASQFYLTANGTIEMDHLLASCGFLPEFAPVEIEDRLLADGGLSWNAPFDPILDEIDGDLMVYVVDLYARDGRRPQSLEAALARVTCCSAIKRCCVSDISSRQDACADRSATGSRPARTP
jgi:predicted acylesterase/phospholipase RssA